MLKEGWLTCLTLEVSGVWSRIQLIVIGCATARLLFFNGEKGKEKLFHRVRYQTHEKLVVKWYTPPTVLESLAFGSLAFECLKLFECFL